MDRKVHRVWKAFKASKVIPALKGRKVQWVRKDRKAFRAIRVRPGRKGCKAIPVPLVHRDHRVTPARQVSKVLPGRMAAMHCGE